MYLGDSGGVTSAPQDLFIDISNDVTFATGVTTFNQTNTDNKIRSNTIDANTNGRYVRIRANNSFNGNIGLFETMIYIPEPSSAIMSIFGLVALLIRRCRKRARANIFGKSQ